MPPADVLATVPPGPAPAAAADLTQWYRWGWVPLVAGCVVIATAVVIATEVGLSALGYAAEQPMQRVLFITRAFVTSFLLAAWAGWFVYRSRQRIESVKDQLRAQQEELAERARRAQQTAGLGALSRVLAHEIRNPLNGMALHCTLLKRSVTSAPAPLAEDITHLAGILEDETARLAKLVDDYLAYDKRKVTVECEKVAIGALAASVVDVYRAQLEARGVEVSIDDEAPPAWADAAKTKQVIHNLLKNAIEAMPGGGKVALRVVRDGPSVKLTFTDSGSGFEDPSAVFRPFYSTKAAGSGLGLTIVRDLVRAQGGDVAAANAAGGGARITIRLPMEQPS